MDSWNLALWRVYLGDWARDCRVGHPAAQVPDDVLGQSNVGVCRPAVLQALKGGFVAELQLALVQVPKEDAGAHCGDGTRRCAVLTPLGHAQFCVCIMLEEKAFCDIQAVMIACNPC